MWRCRGFPSGKSESEISQSVVGARALLRALAPLFKAHPIEATFLVASVAASSVANTRIWVEFSTINGASQTALNKRHVADYWHNRRLMLVVMVKLALASSLEEFFVGRLCLRWRKVLTEALLERYLPAKCPDSGRQEFPFYRMKLDPCASPNPDQRIADDVAAAISELVYLARELLSKAVSFASWSWVLWRISPKAFQGLLLYALFGTTVTVSFFSKGLVWAQHQVRTREAHFRLALVRVDECAESVAFYRAADAERSRLMAAFARIVRATQHQLWWKLAQGTFQNTYNYVTLILPSMILAPAYFRGEVELGAISQIFSAFGSVKQVLMFVASNFGILSSLQAKGQRLEDLSSCIWRASTSLQNSSEPLGSLASSDVRSCLCHSMFQQDVETVETVKLEELSCDGSSILLRVKGLRLKVHTYSSGVQRERWLGTVAGKTDGSTFDVCPGMNLLLKGVSGIGKSVFLRAVAGLWKEGRGCIQRTNRVFFLPQNPYLPIGNESASSSLREQLLFPRAEGSESASPSTEDLCKVLQTVGLENLLCEPAGLEHQADWALRLSGGERQRLAFARLFVQLSQVAGMYGEGCLVLLDEATSACDEDLEAILYTTLLEHVRRGAIVSVGHRSSLSRFHSILLEFSVPPS